MRRTPSRPAAISSLARAAITLVASVSAGPPCGGLYLKPPSAGGLCDGVTTMPSARPEPGGAPAVGADDRVRHRRGRRVAVAVVDQHGDVVGGQHLERGGPRRLGERVRVAADEERAVVALLAAVVADRLRRRGDVGVVERRPEAGPAVAAGAEGDLLVHVLGVRHPGVVGGDQVGDVDQVTGLGGLSGAGCCVCGCHGAILVPTAVARRGPAPPRKISVGAVETRPARPSSW